MTTQAVLTEPCVEAADSRRASAGYIRYRIFRKGSLFPRSKYFPLIIRELIGHISITWASRARLKNVNG
jgi:hypothetical protein